MKTNQRAVRHARRASREEERERQRRGHRSEPKTGYRCEFHWPKFYRYRVASDRRRK